MHEPKHILALVGDLFFAVRITDVIRALGHKPALLDTAADLEAGLAARPELVLLDLGLINQWSPIVQAARVTPALDTIPLVAFGSHLNVAAQQQARAAGVDRVVANSKLVADLPSVIEQFLA